MLITDITPRHCSRCRKELTDPASRECGVGPICRNKDNHLYAKTIEANLPAASAIVLGTHSADLPPEARERWEDFKAKFLRQMKRAEVKSDLIFTGADFRDCVRDLDYVLSFHMSRNLQSRMVEVVRHLGYPGLAAVLSGEASLSVAKVWFEGGRVYMQGRSCKAGWRRMRRIPGIETPRYRGHQVPYSAPASQFEQFMEVVREHWPLYEGDIESIRSHCEEYVKSNPDLGDDGEPEPEAEISLRSHDFTLKFPWVQGASMWAMINDIKAIPSKDRSYNPETKIWSCKRARLEDVILALKKVFKEENIKIVDSGAATPEGLYGRSNARRPYRRRYSRRRR